MLSRGFTLSHPSAASGLDPLRWGPLQALTTGRKSPAARHPFSTERCGKASDVRDRLGLVAPRACTLSASGTLGPRPVDNLWGIGSAPRVSRTCERSLGCALPVPKAREYRAAHLDRPGGPRCHRPCATAATPSLAPNTSCCAERCVTGRCASSSLTPTPGRTPVFSPARSSTRPRISGCWASASPEEYGGQGLDWWYTTCLRRGDGRLRSWPGSRWRSWCRATWRRRSSRRSATTTTRRNFLDAGGQRAKPSPRSASPSRTCGSDVASLNIRTDAPRRRRLRHQRRQDVHHQRHARGLHHPGRADGGHGLRRHQPHPVSDRHQGLQASRGSSRRSAITARTPPRSRSRTAACRPRTCSAARTRASTTSCRTSRASGWSAPSPRWPAPSVSSTQTIQFVKDRKAFGRNR
jgi:hypothetical protein